VSKQRLPYFLVIIFFAIIAKTGFASKPTDQRTILLTYKFELDISQQAKRIMAWVPLPVNNDVQKLLNYDVKASWPFTETEDLEYGNRYLRFDLSSKNKNEIEQIKITIIFEVTRRNIEKNKNLSYSSSKRLISRFLRRDKLVPIHGIIAKEAAQITHSQTTPYLKARAIYDHITTSVHYDKAGLGWGKGDAIYACNIRKGNCTDFHSLFIGEARSLSIPARFVMGLLIPENKKASKIPGYHCWAEFYINDLGWISLDASEAQKYPKKREELFAQLDANRIQFTIGRDISLPGAQAEPVNYSIYPHIEVDGKVYNNITTEFSFKES